MPQRRNAKRVNPIRKIQPISALEPNLPEYKPYSRLPYSRREAKNKAISTLAPGESLVEDSLRLDTEGFGFSKKLPDGRITNVRISWADFHKY